MYIEKLERPAAKKPRPTKDGWSAEQPRWTPGHGSHACPPWIDPDTKHKVKGKRSRGSRGLQEQRRETRRVGRAQAGRRWSGRPPRQSAGAQRQAGATRLRRTLRCSSSAVSKIVCALPRCQANAQICAHRSGKVGQDRGMSGSSALSAKSLLRALANAERRPRGSADRQAAQNRRLPRRRFRCLEAAERGPAFPSSPACVLGMTYSALGPREQLQGPRHRRQRLSSPPP